MAVEYRGWAFLISFHKQLPDNDELYYGFHSPLSVDWLGLLLALVSLGLLHPDLGDAFQHHVEVTVESLHAAQQLLVVAAINQDLRTTKLVLDYQIEDTTKKRANDQTILNFYVIIKILANIA